MDIIGIDKDPWKRLHFEDLMVEEVELDEGTRRFSDAHW